MSRGPAQLVFRFPLSDRCRFESFVADGNGEVVRRLEELSLGRGFAGCYLYGEAGSGRSHLLQAACHRHGERAGGSAIYLPLADTGVGPAALEGLETLRLVALDDVDRWLGRADAERALLALYQGLQSHGGRLLVSAAAAPAGVVCHYADLASRLRGLAVYRLQPLADAAKAQVLRRLAAARGLGLSDAVLEFWLSRSGRGLASLLDDLDRLDEAALAGKRRVTVPLVKQVLGL